MALSLLPVVSWSAPPKPDVKPQQRPGLNQPLPPDNKKLQAPVGKPALAPAQGQMDLLCKDFRFRSGAYEGQSTVIQYESMTVIDASGARRQVYVPTHILIATSFNVPRAPAGLRGEGLRDGECGVPDAVISIPSGKRPWISFTNPPSLDVTHGVQGGESFSVAKVWLADCPTGVRRFDVRRNNESEFSAAVTEGRTSCVE